MTNIHPLITLVILMTISSLIAAQEISPFTSDGCSAFPDGTVKQKSLWLQCCTDHDFAYWKGGSSSKRRDADIDLYQCVRDVGKDNIALLMLSGVRIGGSPLFPSTFRWGYGWPYPKAYGPLTITEQEKISRSIRTSPPLKDN